MKAFAADLHIHTALSPCASDEMTPPEIVRAARAAALDLIAVCDHNCGANIAAVQEAAGGTPVIIAGIEITTAEEAHVVGLFPDVAAAAAVAETVRTGLPPASGPSRRFGEQRILNARGERIGTEPHMLNAASELSLSETINLIHGHGGIAVAAHVDRPSFSVVSQLGLFPREAGFDAVEVSVAGVRGGRAREFVELGLPILVGSDSHNIGEIGACRIELRLRECTFDGLLENLRDRNTERLLHA